MPKYRRGILTGRQLAFVVAHTGNDTEAARVAGYKNPENAAPKLMAKPAIRKAIEEKQQAVIKASGAELGRKLTKVDVVERLLALADLPPWRTKGTITGQVNALKTIAEIEGHITGRIQFIDPDKLLENKSVEELDFFAVHGHWPEVECSSVECCAKGPRPADRVVRPTDRAVN